MSAFIERDEDPILKGDGLHSRRWSMHSGEPWEWGGSMGSWGQKLIPCVMVIIYYLFRLFTVYCMKELY